MELNQHRVVIKSRDIPITDYFTNLQLEWISYKLRELIYVREDDKKKFNDICRMKAEKINQFSLKNCIKSILNSENVRDKYISLFLGLGGVPNFQYKSDEDRERKSRWDKQYYFNKGVKIEFSDDILEIHYNDIVSSKIVSKNGINLFYLDIKRKGIVDLLKENIK